MHVMRLRSPWQIDRNDGSGPQRCDLPDVSQSGAAQASYQRSFNRPTGLTSEQHLWLFVHEWEGSLESLMVNGLAFDVDETASSCQVDISGCLENHNVIELRLVARGDVQPRLKGPVELGID